ncbi:MAG TPA: GTPase HflX, partial [Kiloniellaceae bacterium]|nr:GTPase HflX [Kiloniellaceae bacterium]
GGFGFMGGPGESQLEIDRRLITDRITRLKKELANVTRTRAIQRESRRRVPFPIIALVGYTNAGKSTLFNRLTTAAVLAEDQLFATLDPTLRQLRLPSGREVILSDTVGFISELPPDLIAAFRATLEEVTEADILLHVRDVSNPESGEQKKDVEGILATLGWDTEDNPQVVEVLNKIDLLPPEARNALENEADRMPSAVLCSAATGEGCDALLALLDAKIEADHRLERYVLPLSDGASIAWLYENGRVVEQADDELQTVISVMLSPADAKRFASRLKRQETAGLTKPRAAQ